MRSRGTVVAVTAVAVTALAVIAATMTACDRAPAVTSCNDALHGVWVAPGGARWALLDHGTTLEAFALFDDTVPGGAPRVIDLARAAALDSADGARADKLTGEVKRRFMRGGDACVARAPIRITRCGDRELELVVADPPAPLGYAPCTWPRHAPSRVERWRRE